MLDKHYQQVQREQEAAQQKKFQQWVWRTKIRFSKMPRRCNDCGKNDGAICACKLERHQMLLGVKISAAHFRRSEQFQRSSRPLRAQGKNLKQHAQQLQFKLKFQKCHARVLFIELHLISRIRSLFGSSVKHANLRIPFVFFFNAFLQCCLLQ